MPDAISTFLGGWWDRLFGRFGWSRWQEPMPAEAPAPDAIPALGLSDVPTAVLHEGNRLSVPVESREAVRLALVATLRGATFEQAVSVAATADAEMMRQRTLDGLKNLQQIPALQSFAQSFLRTLGRSEVDVADVVEVVAKDSALCVRILRMANSVLVSPERRIDDLDTAVQMLGLARVRKTAQTLFTLRDGNRVADGFDWRHLWLHAIATASIADELDENLRGEAPPSLHVAALLHDVGKIVLSTVAPDEYRTILVATWQDRGRLEELERARLGVDHREAGVHFARQSGLPEVVIQAIAHHDQPEQAESFRFEVALVSIANYVSKAHGLGFSGARLDAADGEFANLPAWRVIEAELGYRPDVEAMEANMSKFAPSVRAELREMHDCA